MIGIFGGTFNPIHFGHLRAALEVKDYFQLRQLHLIPSAQPPHRQQPGVSAAVRLHMLELAIAHHSGLLADDRELRRQGHSYTIDTLRSLQHQYPGETLVLAIGMDAFHNLQTWHQWQQLFDVAHIVILTRPGYPLPELDDFYASRVTGRPEDLTESPAGKLFFLPITPLDISASAIRKLFAEQRNPAFLLPDSVIAYINQHGLYNGPIL